MMPAWLGQAADGFWDAVGEQPPFPRDLRTVAELGLPVWCVLLPDLRISAIEDWLAQRRLPHRFLCADRSLCGCLVAAGGKGTIFLCYSDPPAEQRFTAAHEVAHFLMDYHLPRQRAIAALGDAVLPVLNGERPPNQNERIDSVLGQVALGLYVDLMPRGAGGEVDQDYVLRAEHRADLLALELLAPQERVRREIGSYLPLAVPTRIHAVASHLRDSYGLPHTVATTYARHLLRDSLRPTVREWLGV